MQVTCAACGEAFEAERSRAKYCSATCRQRGHRAPDPDGPMGSFEAATRTELERLGRLDSMLGQQALVIARRMMNGTETGSAVATLSKEHSRLMVAVAGGARVVDPVDEVGKRRDAKSARASAG